MEPRDKVAIVTGGASGIGLALARRLAAEGARGVVLADLDGDGAQRAAAALGDGALGMRCDVTSAPDLEALIAGAEERFGAVDLFCANAGVPGGTGLGTPEEWELALGVNVVAHITAARRLLPGWLERGSGYFLATASAAGLVSQIGSAPYAVTKHAAVAFAEWLSITFHDRGVRASCLCPMGVNTPMLDAGVGADGGLSARDVVAAAGAILEPDEVAEIVVAGLRDERFLILPHPQVGEFFRRKGDDYDRWLKGMRRLQGALLSLGDGPSSP